MEWKGSISSFILLSSNCSLNTLLPSVPFLYPLKTSENPKFSDTFRGYKKGTPGRNRLNFNPRIITPISSLNNDNLPLIWLDQIILNIGDPLIILEYWGILEFLNLCFCFTKITDFHTLHLSKNLLNYDWQYAPPKKIFPLKLKTLRLKVGFKEDGYESLSDVCKVVFLCFTQDCDNFIPALHLLVSSQQ